MNSKKATRFRQWATKTLKEYIQKGFVLNDEMMKNGRPFGKDYFDELLERIREEKLPCVLCINKIDTVERKDDLLAVIAAYSEVYPDFDAIIPISARTGDGLEELLAQMQRYACEGPQLFPDGMTTDQPDQQVCVRHGPAFFPFGDGLPHHMESGGQLLLGDPPLPAQFLQPVLQACTSFGKLTLHLCYSTAGPVCQVHFP